MAHIRVRSFSLRRNLAGLPRARAITSAPRLGSMAPEYSGGASLAASLMVTSQGGWPPRAWTTTSARASVFFMCSTVHAAASVSGATAGAPSTGEYAVYLSHPRANPKASDVVGQPENIAVCTLPSRAATPSVVSDPGRRAPGSSTPWARGERPVSSDATIPAVTVVGARCASNLVLALSSSARAGYMSWLSSFDGTTPAKATTTTTLAAGAG